MFYLVLVVMINSPICSECLMTHSAVHLQNYPSQMHQLKNNKKKSRKSREEIRETGKAVGRGGFVCVCVPSGVKKINQVVWRDQGRKTMTHSRSMIQQEDQNRAIISWQVMQRAAVILLPIFAMAVLLSI